MINEFSLEVERVIRETDESILVYVDEDEHVIVDAAKTHEVWIPKNRICESSEVKGVGDSGTLTITRWLAEQRGWTE